MITITDKARQKLLDVMVDENASTIRFGLQGGGCNGFTYFFSVNDKKEEDDLEIPVDDNSHFLIVDPISLTYLENAEIDYKKDLMGETFVFNNPNTNAKCGCGNSVSF